MNLRLLMLLGACLLFRYLAAQAKATFYARLAALFRRPVGPGQLRKLLRENPERRLEFRRRVLPFCGGQIALDTVACMIFVLGFSCFPPEKIGESDLLILQRGAVLIVAAAFAAELLGFLELFRGSLSAAGDSESNV